MASEIQVKDTVCILLPGHERSCEIPLGPLLKVIDSRYYWSSVQLQLLLAGVPSQSGPAVATHVAVGRGSD